MSSGCVWLFFLLIIDKSKVRADTQVLTTSADRNKTIVLVPSTTRTIAIGITQSKLVLSSKINQALHGTSIYNATVLCTPTTVSSTTPYATPTSTRLTPAPPQRVGFCAKYTGVPCQDILKSSLLQYSETERYFDANYGINKTMMFLALLLKESVRLIEDKRCKWLTDVALCQYTLSPCTSDGRPISYCREDCESLTRECKVYLNRLIGSAGVRTDLQGFDFSHLVLPTNCSVYSSGRARNASCVYIGLFDHSQLPASKSHTKWILWVGTGAGSSIIILLAIILICCIRRRKKKQRKEFLEEIALRSVMETERFDPDSTMKERIWQLLQKSSLSSKVAEMYDPRKLRQFSLDKIEYISDLGEGQFGLVFKGAASGIDKNKDATEQTFVAVKTLKTDCNDHSKKEFNQEVALMSVLDHPNIVNLMAVATEEEPYCMIFEFMEFGDLNQFLRKIKSFDDAEEPPELELCLEDFLSICHQVASGMSYLASLHFVHRDLATRNCLVGRGLVVKIADFGLARDIYSSDYYKVRGDAMLPVRWMPPEAVLHGKFTVESDVFSYGVVMWEVFTCALQPYYGYTNEEVIGFAKQGVLLGQPEECPDHIYKLMLDCWLRKPEKRPDFRNIMKRLVKDPPVSDYCIPGTLSVTAEEARDSLTAETSNSLAVAGEESRLSAASERARERCPVAGKAENHYVSPGAVLNSGFKPDSATCSGKANTLPLVGSRHKLNARY